MNGSFRGAFAELQQNVNATLATLQRTMREVRASTDAINANSGELRTASDDLSKRTEQQAAALEETSAALEEITAAVKNSTERANEATVMVGDTTFDMEMARAAGAGAIGVTWGYHAEERLAAAGAHAIVDRGEALLAAIERQLAAQQEVR